MKILFLTRRFYPDIGGVEKHIEKISFELTKEGHEVTIISENSKNYESHEKINGIEIHRISIKNEKGKKWTIWKWLNKNRNLIKEADIIHAHDVYYWYFPFRFIYPLKKSFITFHGYESYPIKKSAILIRKLSEKLSNGNIIVGDFIKKWYGTKPNFVIYGGVNLSKKFISPKKHSELFIGRLDEHTGILEYISAWKEIGKSYPDFKMTVIGEGKYKNKIPKEIKVFSRKDAEKEIQKYEFAFVSRYLSILESMANKRLVFALYDNPVKEDYLKMTPFKDFVVISKNSEELAKKIEYYLKNPNKEKEMIEKAYKWVSDKTWENVTLTYLQLWK